MPRPKLHADPAARQRAWYERAKAAGALPKKRGDRHRDKHRARSGRHISKFERAEFIAIDGEGWDVGPELTWRDPNDVDSIEYRWRAHHYTMLAASTGEELWNDGKRLTAAECLDFLCALGKSYPRGIIVCYGAGYDMGQMLLHDLPRAVLEKLHAGGAAEFQAGSHIYRVTYRPRKQMMVMRFRAGEPFGRRLKSGRWKMEPEASATLWDVLGFHQSPFIDAIETWLGSDHPTLEHIEQMKARRGEFALDQASSIREYNRAELDALVAIMGRWHASVAALDLKLSRFDGAGALAAAMLRKHGIKDAKAAGFTPAFDAARHAFAGGRIEAMMIGHHMASPIYHYDINSAYPTAMLELPDLSHGRWSRGAGEPVQPGFTVVECSYRWAHGLPFYPLFYRARDGSINYPAEGRGWYWMPEFEAAREFERIYGGALRVHQSWHFEPGPGAPRPFDWIETYYRWRREYAHAPDDDWRSGASKVIKLGLNSLYGKTAQQVGSRVTRDGSVQPPAYFQLEWSGYITSRTRAAVTRAGMQAPESIISFATDGVYSLEPLDLPNSSEKKLGEWDFNRHEGMTIVMPGVYWLHEKGDRIKPYSRGFDKGTMDTPEYVLAMWRKGKEEAPFSVTRLIGLGSALASKSAWKMRGCFVSSERILSIRGYSSKRLPLTKHKMPHRGFCRLAPSPHPLTSHVDDLLSLDAISAPYKIEWLGDAAPGNEAMRTEIEQDAEEADAAEA